MSCSTVVVRDLYSALQCAVNLSLTTLLPRCIRNTDNSTPHCSRNTAERDGTHRICPGLQMFQQAQSTIICGGRVGGKAELWYHTFSISSKRFAGGTSFFSQLPPPSTSAVEERRKKEPGRERFRHPSSGDDSCRSDRYVAPSRMHWYRPNGAV